jgi:lysophospholipase L1-like esterase
MNRRALFRELAAAAAMAQASADAQHESVPSNSFPRKRDWRDTPFRVAVAFGESTTAGGTATRREFSWVARLADLINESQLQPVKMINSGLGANVISPRSPIYEKSHKPSALERYEKHVLAHQPDLVLISFGFNDSRGGTPLHMFLEDLRHIAVEIKERSKAVVVLVNAYFMLDFSWVTWDKGGIASIMGFNAAEKQLAAECDVLYADVFSAEGMAPWLIDPDGVHANDVGHRLIADKIFEILATNCSCLTEKTRAARKNFKPWRDESVLRRG